MNPFAYLAHSSPGRIRITIPSMRNDSDFFRRAADALGEMAGVATIRTNPRSASILILHDGLTTDVLGEHALAADLFELQTGAAGNEIINKEFIQALGTQALGIGGTLPKSMFFYLLIGLAVRQTMKGQFTAPAVSMIWYALEILEQAKTRGK